MTIRPNGRYDPDAVIAVLANHTIPGAEATDARRRTHSRHLFLGGKPVAVTLHFLPDMIRLDIHNHHLDVEFEKIGPVVRRWLDFDADLKAVHAALGTDPALAVLLARRRGLRITGYPDPFEGAVMTVLGQHVSRAATRTFGGRLVAATGGTGALGLRRFPEAEALAAVAPATLKQVTGITAARARTIQMLAVAVADGLCLDADGDRAGIRRSLSNVPGIGPWTIEYIALRCLADRDAYPVGDRVLQRALDGIGYISARAACESWRPFRAYAAAHLWAAADSQATPMSPQV
jgi:3-methyladenine DNA glycosylase/8-oxoguanine DNA glycosylase